MADKGEYRGIYVALPDSPEFQRLSADARSCFYPIKLKLGKGGIDVFYPEMLPRLTGLPYERCQAAVEELEREHWLVIEENVFWLRNGLRYDPANPLKSPNQCAGISSFLTTLPKLKITNDFARYYELGLPFPELAGVEPSPKGSERGVPTDYGRLNTEDGTLKTEELGRSVGQSVECARADFDPEGFPAVVAAIATAGMIDNPKLTKRKVEPVDPDLDANADTVEAWLSAGIPPRTVLEEVYHSALAYRPKPRKPQIRVLAYFDEPVRKRHLIDTSRAVDRPAGQAAPTASAAGSGPKSVIETPGKNRTRELTAAKPLPEKLVVDLERYGLKNFAEKVKPFVIRDDPPPATDEGSEAA